MRRHSDGRQAERKIATRRKFLARAAGLGSFFYAQKLLGSTALWRAQPALSPLERLIIVYHPDGVFLEQWHPSEFSGPIQALNESLAPLKPFADQLLLFRRLSLLSGQGDGHDEAARCLLTGSVDAQGGSLDVHLADALRQPLLHVGALASKAQGHSVSFIPGGAEKIADDSPLAVYRRLFPDQATIGIDPSVLQSVERELQLFIAQVNAPHERIKLEQHLTQLRILSEIKQVCAAYDLSGFPYDESLKWEDSAAPLVLRMQLQNLVEALSCRLSRVATLQLSRHTSPLKMDYDWLKGWNGQYAMESHQASHNNGQIHAQQKKWINQQLASLFRMLADRPEPTPGRQGSMLDNTLVLVVTEIAQGASHTRRDMPFYLVGGGALPGYRTGRILSCADASHSQLLVSLSQAMGVAPQGSYAGAGPLRDLFA